jgi:hypothetical protein
MEGTASPEVDRSSSFLRSVYDGMLTLAHRKVQPARQVHQYQHHGCCMTASLPSVPYSPCTRRRSEMQPSR